MALATCPHIQRALPDCFKKNPLVRGYIINLRKFTQIIYTNFSQVLSFIALYFDLVLFKVVIRKQLTIECTLKSAS